MTAILHAVVVTYHPDQEFCERLKCLTSQFDKTWIVNNGGALGLCDGLITGKSAQLLEMGHNAGISSAINSGVAAAAQEGAEWAVLFDQDSRCPGNFSAVATVAIDWATQKPGVALFAPSFTDSGKIYQQPRQNQDSDYPKIKEAITSGSLIRISCFQQLAGYDESYFIDFVDHDYLMRLSRAGFSAHALPLKMPHSIGNGHGYRPLGLRFTVTHHSAGRLYASGHNLVKLLRRHFRAFPSRCMALTFRELVRLIKIALLETGRRAKLGAWGRGVWRALVVKDSCVRANDLSRG